MKSVQHLRRRTSVVLLAALGIAGATTPATSANPGPCGPPQASTTTADVMAAAHAILASCPGVGLQTVKDTVSGVNQSVNSLPDFSVDGPDGMTIYPSVPDFAAGINLSIIDNVNNPGAPILAAQNVTYPDGYAIYSTDPGLAPVIGGEQLVTVAPNIAEYAGYAWLGYANDQVNGAKQANASHAGINVDPGGGGAGPCGGDNDKCIHASPVKSWPATYHQGSYWDGTAAWTYLQQQNYQQGNDHYDTLWAQNSVTLKYDSWDGAAQLYSVYNKVHSTSSGTFVISNSPLGTTKIPAGNPRSVTVNVGAGGVSVSSTVNLEDDSFYKGANPNQSDAWAEWDKDQNPARCGSSCWEAVPILSMVIYDRPANVSETEVNMISGAQVKGGD